MSSEQPEVETQTAPAVAANSQADITQQATTPTPTTRVKNPKRVAAGKRVAERTRIAREQQKKQQLRLRSLSQTTMREPQPRPLSRTRQQKKIAASPSPNGSALAVWLFPLPGFISNVKKSWPHSKKIFLSLLLPLSLRLS